MNRLAFALAVATTISIFALLVVGGTVNPSGSSLACPDWPTCYGSFFPEMKDGVQYEHTHRLVATAVGLMTLVLAWAMWRVQPRDKAGRLLAVLAVLLVVLQGVLGGVTVLLKLPTAISAGHLALSMIVFAYFIFLSFRLWPGGLPTGQPRAATLPRSRAVQAAAALVVLAQILLGGLVRHLHAGRACNDEFPWCGGELWPAWGPAQLHMLHRWAAVAVTVVVLLAAAHAIISARRGSRRLALRLAWAAPVIVALQFLLGVLTVTSNIGVFEAAAHLGGGALLLADFVCGYFAFGPMVLRVREPSPVPLHAKAEALS